MSPRACATEHRVQRASVFGAPRGFPAGGFARRFVRRGCMASSSGGLLERWAPAGEVPGPGTLVPPSPALPARGSPSIWSARADGRRGPTAGARASLGGLDGLRGGPDLCCSAILGRSSRCCSLRRAAARLRTGRRVLCNVRRGPFPTAGGDQCNLAVGSSRTSHRISGSQCDRAGCASVFVAWNSPQRPPGGARLVLAYAEASRSTAWASTLHSCGLMPRGLLRRLVSCQRMAGSRHGQRRHGTR